MSSSPDLSALSLSSPSQQRLHDTYDYEGNNGGNPRQYHFSTSPPISAPSQYNPLAVTQSPIKKPTRAGLPSQWLDSTTTDNRSLSPNNNSDFSSSGGSPPMGHLSAPANTTPMSSVPSAVNPEDEIIPTAIVIKNIPFNVKRETLLDIIASLSIPTPYAFNYHLDQQGSFRGLAFANFRQAADADAVVAALNGFDVQGRKLRVEYKKVLQAGEKERIEREKAIRRMRSMQLEKEQQSVAAAVIQQPYDEFGSLNSTPMFSAQRSFSASSAYAQQPQSYSSPNMPITQSYSAIASAPAAPVAPPTPTASDRVTANELDLNDPSTLEIYSRILLFRDDHMRDELAFSRTLTPKQRRVVHLIAQKLGVYHYSVGEGDERYAVVTRVDPQRQPLRHTLSRAPSAYLNPGASQAPMSLRVKKSMPDMKTLHSQAPRLNSRSSNGNIREGFATLATPTRRISVGFSSLFGGNGFGSNNNASGNGTDTRPGGSAIPPVPSLPSSAASLNGGGHDSPSSVVRQPRGPGVGGFLRRDARVAVSESYAGRGGLEAQTHEPLEI